MDQALQVAGRTKKLDARSAARLYHRAAMILLADGRRAEALRMLDKAERLEPTSAAVLRSLASLHLADGRAQAGPPVSRPACRSLSRRGRHRRTAEHAEGPPRRKGSRVMTNSRQLRVLATGDGGGGRFLWRQGGPRPTGRGAGPGLGRGQGGPGGGIPAAVRVGEVAEALAGDTRRRRRPQAGTLRGLAAYAALA